MAQPIRRPQPQPQPQPQPKPQPKTETETPGTTPTGDETMPAAPPPEYAGQAEQPASAPGSALAKVWVSIAKELVRNHADSLCGTLGIDRETMGEILGGICDEFCE